MPSYFANQVVCNNHGVIPVFFCQILQSKVILVDIGNQNIKTKSNQIVHFSKRSVNLFIKLSGYLMNL